MLRLHASSGHPGRMHLGATHSQAVEALKRPGGSEAARRRPGGRGAAASVSRESSLGAAKNGACERAQSRPLKTQGLKQTRHGVGGRRTALLLRLGLYNPPSSRTASSCRFVGGRPLTPAGRGVANSCEIKSSSPQKRGHTTLAYKVVRAKV